jgi:hypothetical protein
MAPEGGRIEKSARGIYLNRTYYYDFNAGGFGGGERLCFSHGAFKLA